MGPSEFPDQLLLPNQSSSGSRRNFVSKNNMNSLAPQNQVSSSLCPIRPSSDHTAHVSGLPSKLPRILPDSTMPTNAAPGMLFLHWSILRQNRLSQQTHSQRKEFTCLGHIVKAPTTWKAKIFAVPYKIRTGSIEIFSSENYPHDSKDTEFKRTIPNFIKELKELRENTKKHLNELRGVTENTWVMPMKI